MPGKTLIAVVDDDEAVRQAIRSLMNAMGFVAEAFASAEDFLNSDAVQATSCLIADVHMPRLTDIELYVRLIASGYVIPTILITAYADDRSRARALGLGIICYLAKPFSEDDLLNCIRSGLQKREANGCHGCAKPSGAN